MQHKSTEKKQQNSQTCTLAMLWLDNEWLNFWRKNLIFKTIKLSFHPDPEAISSISVIGSTTNMTVSWTCASGIVWSYSVILSSDLKQVTRTRHLSNDTVTALFPDLTPGVVHCVVVVTHVDSLNTTSSKVCNATRESWPSHVKYALYACETVELDDLHNLMRRLTCNRRLSFSPHPSWPHQSGVSVCGGHQLHLVPTTDDGSSTVQLHCVQCSRAKLDWQNLVSAGRSWVWKPI